MKIDKINVYWEHKMYVPKSHVLKAREKTTCYIEEEGELQVMASVGRFYKDSPNRKIAIRESFKKAVSKIEGKSLRTSLWDEFKKNNMRCINC